MNDIAVHPLQESQLPAADHIMRVAFGTFLGVPDPASFFGDVSFVRTRWKANPRAAFAAVLGGQVAGSNFATNWGSVGFFGPLTIRPDLWDKGVGKLLMEPVMACFEQWGTAHAGLFTFAQSQKHVGLYQRFGFFPRFLTAIMSRTADPAKRTSGWTRFSDAPPGERPAILDACRELTSSIHDGLDFGHEIRAVAAQNLGETVLLQDNGRLAGVAVCHMGPETEAGSGVCYVKCGAAGPGKHAPRHFGQLLDACEELAASSALPRLVAGVNTARHEAYREMLARGFRTDLQGVSMARPNDAGYNRPGVYLVDDWR